MNTKPSHFVLFQGDIENHIYRANTIKKIDVELSGTIDVFINEEHWESFDNDGIGYVDEERLQVEILKEVAKNLNDGCSHIDFNVLIENAIDKIKSEK